MSETIISMQGITKSYGKHQVLHDVNLDIQKGDIFGLIGRNGAGKTTLFKAILGLSDYKGKLTIAGSGNLSVGKIDAVGESDAATANQPVVLTEAETTKQSEPGWIGEVREADEGEDCSLVGMYSRCRLLSGPWSVKRRLEAARIRGDTEEEERLTELLEEVVCEALKAEEDD